MVVPSGKRLEILNHCLRVLASLKGERITLSALQFLVNERVVTYLVHLVRPGLVAP